MSTNGHTHDEDAVSRGIRPSLGELSWIGIVVAIGVVQIFRQQWFDLGVFALTAAVLTADATGHLPSSSRARRVGGRMLLGVGTALAVIVALLPRHTTAMMLAVGIVGVAALVVVWPGTGPREPWPRGLKLLAWWWAAIIIAGCLWELAQFIRGRVAPDIPSPALSDLLNPWLSTPAGHAAFAIVWVAAGVFLVRRAVRR